LSLRFFFYMNMFPSPILPVNGAGAHFPPLTGGSRGGNGTLIFILRCDLLVMWVYMKMQPGGKGSVVSALVLSDIVHIRPALRSSDHAGFPIMCC
jgi:hypothetical protein